MTRTTSKKGSSSFVGGGGVSTLTAAAATFLLLLLLLSAPEPTSALRFSHNPISVDTDVLVVGRPSTLTCNYVKFRIETIREISWFFGYNGMKMKVFNYNVGTGEKVQ